MITRTIIIQNLIDKIGARSYLEVGTQWGANLNVIKCERKVGVDPDTGSAATHFMTSDDFFKQNVEKFQICFVDGYHERSQCKRDIESCLAILEPGGFVLAHDMLPTHKDHQENPAVNGDCWKAFVDLRTTRTDLSMATVNEDWGVGVICKGHQELLEVNEDLDWNNFDKNKFKWMNIISYSIFERTYLL